MQVVIDSLLTHYTRSGAGKVVVLLHGWADSSSTFAALQKDLCSKYDVIALDLPGFGKTEIPKEVWTLSTYTHFVQHFLAKLGVQQVHAFVGHSNGASLAIQGLADGTLSCERLVIMAGAGIRGVQQGRLTVLKLLTKAGKFVTLPLPQRIRKRLRASLYEKAGSDMLVAPHMQETFKNIVSEDVQADAAQIAIPVLLLYGENDADTPVWFGQQYHELMIDSTLEVLPGAGHFVHVDRTEEVQRSIKEFLR